MTNGQALKIADEILDLYEKYGGAEYAGEKVSQLEHMVQAAQLAEGQGYEEDVILSAFLHDIGHICVQASGAGEAAEPSHDKMDGFGVTDHEGIGAEFLAKRGFSRRVVRLVESHVEAKRWLTLKEPGYYERLSEASKRTLEYQGGPMAEDEAAAFEQYPLFDLIIKMRKWDEQAKVERQPLPELARYRQMIVHHLVHHPESSKITNNHK
jgi:2-amino-1-hydroxyethylphosphonate dioxygenase (glycine-forming)